MVLGTKYKLSLINDFGIFLDMLVSSRCCRCQCTGVARSRRMITGGQSISYYRLPTLSSTGLLPVCGDRSMGGGGGGGRLF